MDDSDPAQPAHSKWTARLVAVFTGVLCLFTLIQIATFVVTQRAFVFPTEADFGEPLVPHDTTLSMYLDLQNSGRSAATIEGFRAAITHGPLPDEPIYLKADEFGIAPVVANGNLKQQLTFITNWSQETINQVLSGKEPLYYYGRIEYTDSFNWFGVFGPRKSRFCFEFVPDSRRFQTCRQPAYTYTD